MLVVLLRRGMLVVLLRWWRGPLVEDTHLRCPCVWPRVRLLYVVGMRGCTHNGKALLRNLGLGVFDESARTVHEFTTEDREEPES